MTIKESLLGPASGRQNVSTGVVKEETGRGTAVTRKEVGQC
jgi:hypothetical protein